LYALGRAVLYGFRMSIATRAAAFLASGLCAFTPVPSAAAEEQAATARLIEELGLRESRAALRERPGWRAPRKVVVLRADAARIAWLRAAAPGVELVAAPAREDALREAADADAVIGSCAADVVGAGKRLRWVQHLSAGVERCALADLAERGIALTNMQKIAGPVMSEHVLALVLGLARGLATYVPLQARGAWQDEAVPEGRMWSLGGRTMLVVGLGGIGTETARRAHALGMKVIAIRNSGTEGPPFVAEVGLGKDLHAFAGRADVIVNTLPLTEETRGLFDDALFDAAKDGALFVNVGRGGTVVTADLVAALEDGRIGGAGLDVTDPEPLPADHPLWRASNVIITPHVSASDEGNEEPRWLIARENLRRFAEGGKLLSEVDPARGY
jgi:phosphoglycerate dehydrogenase-like enzyme